MENRYVVLINGRDPNVWEAFPVTSEGHPIRGSSLEEITQAVVAQRELNEPDEWLWRPDKFCVLDTQTDQHYWPVGPFGNYVLDESGTFDMGPPELGPSEDWAGWWGATDSQAIAISHFLDQSVADFNSTGEFTRDQFDQLQAVWDSQILNNCQIVQAIAEIIGV